MLRSNCISIIRTVVSVMLLAAGSALAAQTLDLGDAAALQTAASSAITNLLKMYEPTARGAFDEVATPWFASALIWDMLYDYQRWTGDDRFASTATGALSNMSFGPLQDILGGANAETLSLAGWWNDDIAWAAISIQSGAEIYGYDNIMPNANGPWSVVPSKTMDQIFNQWTEECGGGLLWSRNRQSTSADYKSAITNWEAITLGARIYLQNKDKKQLQRAKDTWDWLFASSMAMTSAAKTFDGLHQSDCSTIINSQWTYNYGEMLRGAAFMSQATGDQSYFTTASAFLQTALSTFADQGSPVKEICEAAGSCNRDQAHFKGVLLRNLAYFYRASSSQQDKQAIEAAMQNSVAAMLRSCDTEWNCGGNWTVDTAPVIYPADQHAASALLVGSLGIFASQTGPGLLPKMKAGSLTVTGTAPTDLSAKKAPSGVVESVPLSPALRLWAPVYLTTLPLTIGIIFSRGGSRLAPARTI